MLVTAIKRLLNAERIKELDAVARILAINLRRAFKYPYRPQAYIRKITDGSRYEIELCRKNPVLLPIFNDIFDDFLR